MFVFAHKQFLIAVFVCFCHGQDFFSCFAQQFELCQPWFHFFHQWSVFGVSQQDITGFCHSAESFLQGGIIVFIVFLAFYITVGKTLGNGLQGNGFVTTISVSVSSQIGIMCRKEFQFFGRCRHNVFDGIFPSLFTVILFGVP